MAEGQQVAQKTNTLAIVSLVLAFLAPLFGIILGIVALGQIKKTNEGGKNLAMAGIVVGAIIMVIYIILGIVLASAATLTVTRYY